jgi:hypothetical protein
MPAQGNPGVGMLAVNGLLLRVLQCYLVYEDLSAMRQILVINCLIYR